MFQVCFTACLAEEGKESRKGYSIYYYARANARASDSCEKSTRKQESRRFSISGKDKKREKVPVWLEKTWQAASAKCKRFRMKNRDDGEKTRQEPAQDRQKKMLREPKNTGMADKKTASSIRKTQKIPDKNRDDGGKTRQAPAQNKQKKSSRNPKYRYGWKKHGKWHPQNAKDSG